MCSGNQVWGSACTKPGIYDWAAMHICVRGSACTKPGIYDWAAMYICVRGSACTKPGIYDWAAMYICVRGIKFGEVPVPWLVYMYARPCTYVFGESSLALFL
jgi:hypothetical protein